MANLYKKPVVTVDPKTGKTIKTKAKKWWGQAVRGHDVGLHGHHEGAGRRKPSAHATALKGRRLCLCQIVELVVLAPSTASKHMSILRQSRLVDGRKSGRWMYYRLTGEDGSELVQRTLALVLDSLADDPRVARDAERLKEILQIDPQAFCESLCAPEQSCSKSRKTSARRRTS